MYPLFRWIENTGLSMWIGQSSSVFAFPTILVFHTLGMALLVGASAVIDLRMLGFAPHIRVSVMERFFPVLKIGFVMNALSGILLLIAYPTKALTNPLFYVKLACIGLAIWVMLMIRGVLLDPQIDQRALSQREKRLAALSLVLWTMAIAFGRLLEYTYTRLYVDFSDR